MTYFEGWAHQRYRLAQQTDTPSRPRGLRPYAGGQGSVFMVRRSGRVRSSDDPVNLHFATSLETG